MTQRHMKVEIRRPRNAQYDYDKVCEDDPVKIVPEPENPVDKNALRIDDQEGKKMGYVPAEIAKTMAPMLKNEVIKLLGSKICEVIHEHNWDSVYVDITFDDLEG